MIPTRRKFLRGLGAGVAAAALPAVATEGIAQGRQPNVLLILADDLGYECLRCYGGTSYQTPHLDALAAGGVRFGHCYAQPLCTPTRVQLMTGQYNFRNWQAFGVMDPDATTFGHVFQDAGYATCIAGKWQLYSYNPPDYEPDWRGKGMHPKDAGFDEYCLWHAEHTEDKGSRYADPVILQNGEYRTDLAGKYGPDVYTEYLLDFMGRHREEPFFAYYPMALTHGPFENTPGSADWADEHGRRDVRYFGDMVLYMDTVVGRLVQGLDDLGLRENTLVIFLGDNGTPREIVSRMGDRVIPGGKGTTTEAGTRVPLIVNLPGTAPAGVVNDDLVDTTDFLPTLLDFCRVAPPPGLLLDGRSFLPQLMGEPGVPREWVFFHHDPLPGWSKAGRYLQRWAQDQRWKLYEDGRFYNVATDVLEAYAIPVGQGGREGLAARRKLERVLYRMR